MPSVRRRNLVIFLCVAVIWIAFDQLTKLYFGSFEPGEIVAGPFAGLFQFEFVRNTGGAWGIFSDMTAILGIVSLLICALIVFYLFKIAPSSSVGAAVGLALVFAGGIGNAIDRFSQGYVVDFISPIFIDFPVFNIADIGVTCGVAVFVISLLLSMGEESEKSASSTTDSNADGTAK